MRLSDSDRRYSDSCTTEDDADNHAASPCLNATGSIDTERGFDSQRLIQVRPSVGLGGERHRRSSSKRAPLVCCADNFVICDSTCLGAFSARNGTADPVGVRVDTETARSKQAATSAKGVSSSPKAPLEMTSWSDDDAIRSPPSNPTWRALTWQPLQPRERRSAQMGQRPAIARMTGLSGAGQSTIADAVDCALTEAGRSTIRPPTRHRLNRISPSRPVATLSKTPPSRSSPRCSA